jgi:sugar lactone lactonase YvrE
MQRFILSQIIDCGCFLGESPIWHQHRQSWLWTDINNKCIYELPFGTVRPRQIGPLEQMVSNISVLSDDTVLITAENSVAELNLNSGKVTTSVSLPHDNSMRCNDGVMGPDGALWFGTMKKQPDATSGKIYRYELGANLSVVGDNIGIPNTFVWLSDNELLISDSFKHNIYLVQRIGKFLDWSRKKIWCSYNSPASPDGGVADKRNNVMVAIWGAGRIDVRNKTSILTQIDCPMPHVTSCAIGGPKADHLLVTSAQQGLSKQQLAQAPESGNCLIFKIS